jgi:hypothetical protein
LPVRDSVHPELFAGDLLPEVLWADSVPTRCNVRVAALSWEKGLGRAAGRRESQAPKGAETLHPPFRPKCACAAAGG